MKCPWPFKDGPPYKNFHLDAGDLLFPVSSGLEVVAGLQLLVDGSALYLVIFL